MEIWIIQDGEKTGPLHDFEIRRRIENGELHESTPAWHEGLASWRPLGEIELFQREFQRTFETGGPKESTAPQSEGNEGTPPLPSEPHLIRRFWARWFDLYLYSGLWWLAIWAAGRDIESTLGSSWTMLLRYVPWFALEAFLIHRFGTTPGKWLLGIQVVNKDGSPLTLAESTRRASRVLFIGIGFGLNILSLICQLMALFTARRIGSPLWDHAGGHRLQVAKLKSGRILLYIFGLATALMMQTWVLLPYIIEYTARNNPEFREQYEKLQEELHRKDSK